MFNVAEECRITDWRFALSCKHLAGVEDPFLVAVTKVESPTLMGRWKYDHERTKHIFAPRSIDMGLKERPFVCVTTWCQMEVNGYWMRTVNV
jgi:hypothetical protein